MLQDHELFQQLCLRRNIAPPTDVSDAIRASSVNGDLQLSCMSIMIPVCEVIAQMLATSTRIKSVDLSDCMLLPKGLQYVLSALCEGSNVTALNLKGNNISGVTVVQLGQVFVHNNTLKRLNVAWNSLGTQLDSFAKFCDGLTKNHSLDELDLRYNQLSPSCATSLCKVLQWNKSLRSLDLSWNNLGVQGGEMVMHAMQNNGCIETIGLAGNGIPHEIAESVEERAYENRRRRREKEKHQRVRVIEEISLISDTDLNLDLSDRIKELNQILHDRTATIEALTAELATKDAELERLKSQARQLEEENKGWQAERERILSEKSREMTELEKLRRESEETWRGKHAELEASYEKCSLEKREADQKIRRYERDIHKSATEISLLKEKLVAASRSYEDLLSTDKTEMHRLRRVSKELEKRHKIEINVLRNTLKDATQALEECQEQLLRSRNELRELQASQSVLKAKLTETELTLFRHDRLEENLQKAREAKNLLEDKLADSERTVATLQKQVTSLQGELIEPQRRHELLREELEHERQSSERLREELSQERCRRKDQGLQVERLTQQLATLNARLADLQNSHAEVLREKDREKETLKEIVTRKEREISELRAEEVHRAGQLYAAVNKYLGSIGPPPVT